MVNLSIPSWLNPLSHKKSTRLRPAREPGRLFRLPAIPFSTPSYSASPSSMRQPVSPPLSPKSPTTLAPPPRPVSPMSLEKRRRGSKSPPPLPKPAEVWEPPTPPPTPTPVPAPFSAPSQTPKAQGVESRKAELVRFFTAPEGRVGEGRRLQGVAVAPRTQDLEKMIDFEEENRRLMDDEDWDGGDERGFRFWRERLKGGREE